MDGKEGTEANPFLLLINLRIENMQSSPKRIIYYHAAFRPLTAHVYNDL